MTPITYKQAADRLNTYMGRIRTAVYSDRLTQLPSIGRTQHVALEQVDLFKGKSQISLSLLSENELKIWNEIDQAVNNPQQTPAKQQSANQVPANQIPAWLQGLNEPEEFTRFTELAKRVGKAVNPTVGSEVPQGLNFIPMLVLIPV